MRIQPIITTGTTDKGNTYVKSNAGKYFAAAELEAIGVTSAFVALANRKNASKTAAKAGVKAAPFLQAAKKNVQTFIKNPIKSLKEFAGKINMDAVKNVGSHIVQHAKALSPAKKAVILSAVLALAANLGFDFGFNKISAHKADKHA